MGKRKKKKKTTKQKAKKIVENKIETKTTQKKSLSSLPLPSLTNLYKKQHSTGISIENEIKISISTQPEKIPSSYYFINHPIKEMKPTDNNTTIEALISSKTQKVRSIHSTVSFIESLHGPVLKKTIFEFSE